MLKFVACIYIPIAVKSSAYRTHICELNSHLMLSSTYTTIHIVASRGCNVVVRILAASGSHIENGQAEYEHAKQRNEFLHRMFLLFYSYGLENSSYWEIDIPA